MAQFVWNILYIIGLAIVAPLYKLIPEIILAAIELFLAVSFLFPFPFLSSFFSFSFLQKGCIVYSHCRHVCLDCELPPHARINFVLINRFVTN